MTTRLVLHQTSHTAPILPAIFDVVNKKITLFLRKIHSKSILLRVVPWYVKKGEKDMPAVVSI